VIVKAQWIGSTGKADIENNIDFTPGTISKAASITKFFMSTLLFRMMEDSVHTGIGYNAINTKISHWIPSRIIDKLPNGDLVTLGECMNHETGIPDVIEQDDFYLAVLNDPNKNGSRRSCLNLSTIKSHCLSLPIQPSTPTPIRSSSKW
jgi:CubicO group peptidase (beta-lactamase class C family)